MASSKTQLSGGKIPDGFQFPFKRVSMPEPRSDDALACVATLAGRSLDEVTKLAIQLGYPSSGPAYVANNRLITQLLHNLGLNGGEWQEVPSMAALPDVAILMIDWRPELELGRHVVWHHVRGTDQQPSFSYITDPRPDLPPEQQVTTDWGHLKLSPAWYIEVTPARNGRPKR
jgi:hypothetical protein